MQRLGVIALVLLCVSGCMALASDADVERTELTTGWQVRRGDSPRDDAGKLEWLDDGDADWSDAELPDYVISDDKRLWLRIRLPDIDGRDPALLMDPPLSSYEAYVDDEKVDSFGDVEAADEHWYGTSARLVALPEDAAGRTLSLRIRSTYFAAGMPGHVHVGSRTKLLRSAILEELPAFVTGIAAVFLGLLVIFLGLARRGRDRQLTLVFAWLLASIGCYTLHYTKLATWTLNRPLLWSFLHDVGSQGAFISAVLFVSLAIGSGPRRVLAKLWWLHGLTWGGYFAVRLVTGVFTVAAWVLTIEVGFRVLFLVELVLIAGVVGSATWRGVPDARLFALGMLPGVLLTLRDILAAFGVVAFDGKSWAFAGVISMSIALLAIVQRQHRATVERLVREVDDKAREKERILNDLHDGIGGITSNIGLIAEMASRSDDSERHQRAIQEIASLSRDGMQDLRTVLNGLDESDLRWPRLVGELRHLLGRSLEPHNVAHTLDDDLTDDAPPPDSLMFIHVVRIFREAVTNAVKHAHPTTVSASLRVAADELTLSVEDDGERLVDANPGGRGLASMRARAAELGGMLEINSAGIVLRVPLPPRGGYKSPPSTR